MADRALIVGCGLVLLAVALGAFGAHALRPLLVSHGTLSVYETASQYHFYHGFAVIVLGLICQAYSDFKYANLIFWLLLTGTLCFSGSLYLLAILDVPKLGVVTPFGGIILLVAWLMLIVSLCREKAWKNS
jgi:uncharacterized membrane protein YgdD (TMEM256/DUF423 family)